MERHYLDEYARMDTPVHRVEARVKLLSVLALIVFAVLTPPERNWPFAAYLLLISAALILARLPLLFVVKRALWFGPFVLTALILVPFTRRGDGTAVTVVSLWGLRITLYRAGLLAAKSILFKSFISAMSVILLVSTTRFSRLVEAMERMRFPRLLLTTISFLYRYLLLLIDQFMRLNRAAGARNLKAAGLCIRIQAIGGIVGSLFLRTYSRGERIFIVMLSRGYDGTVSVPCEPVLTRADLLILCGVLAGAGGIYLAAMLGVGARP